MKKNKTQVSGGISKFIMSNKTLLILVLLCIVMYFLSPLFLTSQNLLNVFRQISVTAIAASAYTLLLGSGNIDLSVGNILCLVGIVIAQLLMSGVSPVLAILAGIIIGGICGFVNSFFISAFKLPGFIVTMAMGTVYEGIAYVLTKNVPVSGLPVSYNYIGQGTLLGIPVPVYFMVISMALMWVVINRSAFGRHAIAMGGNPDAARVSGINIIAVRAKCFILLGAAVAVAGMVQTARSASAQLTAGSSLLNDAITACVVGGTSMHGGNANLLGTLYGCVIVGVLNNALNLMGVDSNWQIIAKGALILVAMIIDSTSVSFMEKRNKKAQD